VGGRDWGGTGDLGGCEVIGCDAVMVDTHVLVSFPSQQMPKTINSEREEVYFALGP
jgi:hypothetical protein